MASWELNWAHQSDQIVGGSTIQKMVELGVTTFPSGTFFQYRVPAVSTWREDLPPLLDVIAQQIEDTFGGPYITELAYFQDTTQSGQLLDMFQVFWEAADGLAQGWVEFVLAKIEPQIVNPCVQNAVAEALGQGIPYPDADCSPRGFPPGTEPPQVPPGGMPHL